MGTQGSQTRKACWKGRGNVKGKGRREGSYMLPASPCPPPLPHCCLAMLPLSQPLQGMSCRCKLFCHVFVTQFSFFSSFRLLLACRKKAKLPAFRRKVRCRHAALCRRRWIAVIEMIEALFAAFMPQGVLPVSATLKARQRRHYQSRLLFRLN